MSEETTSRLEKILKQVDSTKKANKFAEEHAVSPQLFFQYVNEYFAKHGLTTKDIVSDSGISTNYIYNILNGDTKFPARDKVLAVCIASGMSLSEVNRGLQLAKHNRLYPKNERDILIASFINRGMTNITEINLELDSQGVGIIEV